ncbi:hypothetical protein Ssi03_68660 [Sphaerisporangium siamense]|nr:hypothetical protein Ssi03_68660 [Sphaerisporangium siamense]
MADGAQADLAAAWARTAAAVQDAAHRAVARDADAAHVYAQARGALIVDFDEHGERGSYHGIEGMTLSGLASRREHAVAGLGGHAPSGPGGFGGDAYAGVLDELLAAVAAVRDRAGGVSVHGRVFVLLESIAAYRRGGPVRSADRHRSRLLLWAGPVFAGPAFTGTRLPLDAVGAAADEAVAASRLHAVRVPPPEGETVVLVAPACAGVLLHELCGHLLEADVFRHPGNRLRALMGRRISHPRLTVVDDSADPSSWAGLRADDHGNPGRAVTLLDSGHVAGTLTSGALTPAGGPSMDQVPGAAGDPGGHARRADYRYAALPRMTTMSVLPGADSAPGVLADVRDGVYAEAIGRATCDPVTGRFVAQVDLARRIRDGRLCEPLSPVHVTGDVVEALSSIRAVCDDPAVYDTGCVKQQQTVANRNIAPTLLLTGISCAPRAT